MAAILLLGLLGVAFLVYPQLQAWRHLSAARAAIQKNHNLEAIRHLQICLKTWPNDAEVLFLAARTARRAGAYGEAEQALEKYEAQRGSDELAALERILLRAENGEMNEVDGFCKHWIENGHPDAPFIFEASVRGYLQAYRLSDAWRCVQRWRQEQPNNPQTYYLEGQIHDCSGVSWAALEAYQKVLQADPEHEEARLKLTAALMERRSFTEAVPHLEHLLQHMPDEPLVPVRLALCRDILGQTDEAVRILDELLARQPHCAPALVERGKIALNRGQYEQAESWLREAVALAPGEHEARYQLVQCLRRAGKDAEAQQEDQRLSRLEIDLRRMDEITNLRMSQAPNDPALHGELGAIMLRNGFVEQGMHWLQSALKLDGRCPPAHQALAEYYQQLGDAEKAENHRRLAGIPAPAGGTKPSPTR
ncbi:MAG TPA: tetratricopeptide repeat protein [Gemmataceae bacterium]|nr:tetratricopeptide repeat protein [Gemmataceae bacterium]